MKYRVISLVVGSVITLGQFATALAATATATVAATNGDAVLEEVVVTAQRRSENIQTVPIAITAIDGAALAGKAVASLTDLQTASPSISIGSSGVTNSVNIRGIGLASGLPSVSNGVATYIDGLFQPPILTNNRFYDIADIEILRGPQGTLVGSNSTGGALFINTRSPMIGSHDGYFRVGVGNYGMTDAEAAVNLPLGDVFAVRLSGTTVSRDSFYKSVGPVHTDAGKLAEKSGRLGILFKPGAFQALIKVEYTDRSTGGFAGKAIPGTFFAPFAPSDPFTLNYNTSTAVQETSLLVPVELRYELANGITLRSVSGFQDKRMRNLEDLDYTSIAPLTSDNHIRERVSTEEVNVLSPKRDAYDWILGYYYQKNKISVDIDQTGTTGPGGPPLFITVPNNKKTTGAFGQLNLRFVQKWELGVGLRRSTFSTGGDGFVALNIPPVVCGAPIPGVPPFRAPYNGCLITTLGGEESDSQMTGKVSLNYTPDDNNLIYAFVARGYKPGGASSTTSTFKPETVLDLELGWKASFADNQVRTQISGFHYAYHDFQFQNIELRNGSQNVSNLPTATIYGAEATLQAHTGGFGLDGGLAYVHSSLPSAGPIVNVHLMPPGTVGNAGGQCAAGQTVGCFNYTPFLVSNSGGPNLYSPEWTYNLGVDYRFVLADKVTMTPRLNYSFVGSQFVSTTYSPTTDRLPARGLLSTLVTFKIGTHWNAELYGTNLTDKIYPAGEFSSNYFAFGAPRQYGARFGFDF